MKRYLLTIIAVVAATLGLKAMPYEMAREEAMYLTDKMAYELNLNQRQYEYAYEINLDYLMSLNRPEDAYGMFLICRNEDLRHILYDWQWKIFGTIDYFLRPVAWRYGTWYYPVYAHYARNHFFYSRPSVYLTYRGGHGRAHFSAGFYVGNRPQWNGGFRGADRRRPEQAIHPGTNRGGHPSMMPGGQPGMNRGGRQNGAPDGRPNMTQQPNSPQGQRPGTGVGQQPDGRQNNSNRGNNPGYGMPNNRPSTTQPGVRGGMNTGGTRQSATTPKATRGMRNGTTRGHR